MLEVLDEAQCDTLCSLFAGGAGGDALCVTLLVGGVEDDAL